MKDVTAWLNAGVLPTKHGSIVILKKTLLHFQNREKVTKMARPKKEIKCLNPKCDNNTVFVEPYIYMDTAYGRHHEELYECTKCHERWRAS